MWTTVNNYDTWLKLQNQVINLKYVTHISVDSHLVNIHLTSGNKVKLVYNSTDDARNFYNSVLEIIFPNNKNV